MRMIKKLATILLAICLVVPCFSMVSFAADGKIMFTDPSTKVGETLEVKGVVQKSASTIGKVEITMTYDTSYLDFQSGDGTVESEAGKLTYTGDATNETGSRKEFKLVFSVLKEGTTKISIESATIKNASGTVMNYTHGSSTITIAAGENVPVTDPVEEDIPETTESKPVEIGGVEYTFSDVIPENEIPDGYELSTLEYEWVEHKVVYSADFGLSLGYMIGADGVGEFYMYVEEDATFVPYEEIKVSDSVRIALLSDVSDVVLPSEYSKTEVVLNGHAFPAWQNQENTDYFIIYAINNSGQKSLYQLDNAEKTYQRFVAPEVVEEEVDNSFIGKLSAVLQNHMDYVILGTGFGFILFVLIIVILSVKLYNRNAELDEIYDEYGIDEEDDDKDEDDEDDDDYEDEDDNDGDIEMEMLVQEGMKEVFPEDNEEENGEKTIEPVADEQEEKIVVEPVEKVTTNTVEIPIEKVVEKVTEDEDTLGDILAKQKEEFYDDEDDDDVLDDFSMDFIDLDD